MVSVFEGADENRTRVVQHLFRDWVIVSEVALFVCDLRGEDIGRVWWLLGRRTP